MRKTTLIYAWLDLTFDGLCRKGDYHRYLAEFAGGDGRKGASEAAHESYKQATEIAQSDLAPTHPIRLGLALNCKAYFIICFILSHQPMFRWQSVCFTTKFSIRRIELAIWPNKLLMTPLPSLIPLVKRVTKIQRKFYQLFLFRPLPNLDSNRLIMQLLRDNVSFFATKFINFC